MREQTLATRACAENDFDYAWKVYRAVVRPVIEARLNRPWSNTDEEQRFRGIWRAEHSHIITLDDQPIGWGTAVVNPDSVELEHLYIEPEHRGKGYGTKLLSELFRTWAREGKTVNSQLLKGSRAISLAERLGYARTGEDELTVLMRRLPK